MIHTPEKQDVGDLGSDSAQRSVFMMRRMLCSSGGRRGGSVSERVRCTVSVLLSAKTQGLLRAVIVNHVKHVVFEIARRVAVLVHLEPVLFRHLGL